jgi:oligopeptide/dipeptide ABC transporter ATP-binding protein
MSADQLLVQVNDLKKFFHVKRGFPNPVTLTVRAVDQVSFSVYEGEAFGLVGESGCGKTTVGRCMLRLVEPDAGKIVVGGKDVMRADTQRLRLMRRTMQIIFQDPYSSLNPRRTVGQTLSEPMKVHRLGTRSEIQDRVVNLLGEVGLSPESRDKFPHEFSGGQRQRIGIARALIFQPDLIIADEPVSALDVSIQSQILILLQNLQKAHQLSFVFISHDLAVVRYFCQRVAVMYLGRIVEEGYVKDVFDNPLHPYTRLLREASPIPDPRVRKPAMRMEGEVASAARPPSGCYFHPRCGRKMDICMHQYPSWTSRGPHRGAACHLLGSATGS